MFNDWLGMKRIEYSVDGWGKITCSQFERPVVEAHTSGGLRVFRLPHSIGFEANCHYDKAKKEFYITDTDEGTGVILYHLPTFIEDCVGMKQNRGKVYKEGEFISLQVDSQKKIWLLEKGGVLHRDNKMRDLKSEDNPSHMIYYGLKVVGCRGVLNVYCDHQARINEVIVFDLSLSVVNHFSVDHEIRSCSIFSSSLIRNSIRILLVMNGEIANMYMLIRRKSSFIRPIKLYN